ncbi:hypothetical protein I549_5163 [Mycobacterium avium subsp. avium 2285 (R)]|nr:hypothetical protein I549_5163 [Mycobacterium avium subsp. avium 2285 (R)]
MLVGPRRPEQSRDGGRDRVGLLGALGRIALVVNRKQPHPGRAPVEASGGRARVGMQPALVGQRGHRGADGRVHAVGAVQEVAAFVGQRALPVDQPVQRRRVDRLRVGALADLRQLLRVPEQQQVRGGRATAMVLAKQNWPASSITSRSRLPGGIRLALAKSHAVPPITQPGVSARKAA